MTEVKYYPTRMDYPNLYKPYSNADHIRAMRLIDADALKTKAIRCETFKLYDAPIFLKAVGTKEIDKAPTVDAVPVVRCKYCAVPHNKYTGCPKLNGLVTPPDFYCPFGERKDDAE